MKKTIRIFVAGSKKLNSERDALKALAHDLNKSYKNSGVNFEFQSYNDPIFKDNQDNYNNYIREQADIVIFVLKDNMGDFTRQEFEEAANAYKEKQLPEIMVFMNGYSDDKSGTQEMKDFIKKHLDDHHYIIPYDSIEDLKYLTKDRIRNFASPTYQQLHRAQMLTTAAIAAILIIIIGLFTVFFAKRLGHTEVELANTQHKLEHTQNDTYILFAGGGSVTNFVNDILKKKGEDSITIENYPHSIYANMGSKLSWSLLCEEINRYNREGRPDSLRVVTVSLSADSIKLSELTKTMSKEHIEDAGRIVGCHIGDDPLVVYISNRFNGGDHSSFANIKDYTITPDQLRTIVNDTTNSNNLFITSSESGTLSAYQKLGKTTNLISDNIVKTRQGTFNEATGSEGYGGNGYIIFGSKYYYPIVLVNLNKQSKEKECIPYNVVNQNGVVSKPMYLYFVAFKNPNNQSELIIPRPILLLLKKIMPNIEGNTDGIITIKPNESKQPVIYR